jgi:ubiquinone/menaquinone biosynthesis C-methylase UbiE
MNKLDTDFYENYGEQWSTTDRREMERMDTSFKIKNFCAIMDTIKPKSILDFGSGLGDGLHLLTKHFKAAESIGVDISSTMISFAKKEYPKYTFLQGGIEHVKNYNVDLITFIDVLEHLENIHETLDVAKRSAWYIGIKIPLEKTWFTYTLNLLRLKENKSRAFQSEGHLYEFSNKEVDYILETAGLRIIKSERRFVMEKEFFFNERVRLRMKQKTGLFSKLKYLFYIFFSYVPYSITNSILGIYMGDDYYILCET